MWVRIGIYMQVFAYIGFILILISGFFDRHLIRFNTHVDGVRSQWPAERCMRDTQAVYITARAAPYIYDDYDFGVRDAIRDTQRPDLCDELRRPHSDERGIDNDTRARLQARFDWASDHFIDARPPWYLRRQTNWDGSIEYTYPGSLFGGDLYLILTNYRDLSTGRGWRYYIRCDYNLHLEPYQSFTMAALHRGTLSNDIKDRIVECGQEDVFQTLIDAELASIRASG
jgi:hypothetical protein